MDAKYVANQMPAAFDNNDEVVGHLNLSKTKIANLMAE